MKTAFILAFLLLAGVAGAEPVPDAPSARNQESQGQKDASTSRTESSRELTKYDLRSAYVSPLYSQPGFANSRQTSSRWFWIELATASAATVADVETTRAAVASGALEANPLYGRSPSRAKLYGINVPITAGYAYLVHRFGPSGRRRHLPLLGLTAMHTAGAFWNTSHIR